MNGVRGWWLAALVLCALAARAEPPGAAASFAQRAEGERRPVDWPVTEGAPGGGRYSPLADITPANPLNLYKVTPKLSGWGAPKGVVVVNVFVDDKGEVTAARLLQPLSGDSQKVKDANAACLDAAKRVVFDPARTKDGTPVKVWQGVGFYLD